MPELKPGRDYVGVGVGVMIRNGKGEFLLGQRREDANNEPGRWCFPGGTVEFGETLYQCAVREAMEESGLEVEPVRLVRVIDHILPSEKQHWVNPIIEARVVSGVPTALEPRKMSKWRWFSLDSLPENLTANLVGFFSEIKAGKIKLG